MIHRLHRVVFILSSIIVGFGIWVLFGVTNFGGMTIIKSMVSIDIVWIVSFID